MRSTIRKRVFETPEAVVPSEQVPREHKRTILERWRQLIGSPPPRGGKMAGEPSLATRPTRALAFLDTETGSHEVTHDPGFYTSIGDITKEPDKKTRGCVGVTAAVYAKPAGGGIWHEGELAVER